MLHIGTSASKTRNASPNVSCEGVPFFRTRKLFSRASHRIEGDDAAFEHQGVKQQGRRSTNSSTQAFCQLNYERSVGGTPLHLVSAFAAGAGIILGQQATAEKSNEKTAIPELLATLALEGCIVTIDAMGAQPSIAQAIRDRGANYILSVKDNQPTLAESMQDFLEAFQAAPDKTPHISANASANDRPRPSTSCFSASMSRPKKTENYTNQEPVNSPFATH